MKWLRIERRRLGGSFERAEGWESLKYDFLGACLLIVLLGNRKPTDQKVTIVGTLIPWGLWLLGH